MAVSEKRSRELQQVRVKVLKEVERVLIDIFKSVNENKARINFGSFACGVGLIYD